MKKNKINGKKSVSQLLTEPIFEEFWYRGSYFFIGIFILNGEHLTSEQSIADYEFYYEQIRANRKKNKSRLTAVYLVVPVYCAHLFDNDVANFLGGYDRPRRFRIRFHPILYNIKENTIELRDAVQNDTLFFYPCILLSYAKGVKRAAEHFCLNPKLAVNKFNRMAINIKETCLLEEADILLKDIKGLPNY